MLKGHGFERVSQKGSHIKLRKGPNVVIVPDRGNTELQIGTLRSILRQAGISPDEFERLVRG